jgi:tellurite resistance protein
MADFTKWSHETLVRFATEANEKLQRQDKEIEQLRADLKMTQLAWRAAVAVTKELPKSSSS